MKQIKFDVATKEDILVLKKMWKDIFLDSDEYIQLYFSYKFKEGNTFVVRIGEEIASTLYVEYTDLFIDGKTVKGAYFCGISTLEKYRGRGLAKALIEYAEKNIKKVDIIYLIPANAPLFDFYKGLGFKEFTCLDKINVKRQAGYSIPAYKKDFDFERLTFFYENSGNTLYVKRSREFLEAIYKCYDNISIFEDGYIVWFEHEDAIHLIEYSMPENKAVELLLGLLNEKDKKEGILYKKWGRVPFSVYKGNQDIKKTDKGYINLMLN